MGEIVHTSRIKIVREKGPTRRAMIEGFLYNKRIIQLVPHRQGLCAPQPSFLKSTRGQFGKACSIAISNR